MTNTDSAAIVVHFTVENALVRSAMLGSFLG
jgi:hypothetical protein